MLGNVVQSGSVTIKEEFNVIGQPMDYRQSKSCAYFFYGQRQNFSIFPKLKV